MKKILVILLSIMMIVGSVTVHADEAEMGPFGGITEGADLPTFMEYSFTANSGSTTKAMTYNYKEIVFIGGTPIEVEGTMRLTKGDSKVRNSKEGTYTEKYVFSARNIEYNISLNRSIEIDVTFRNDGKAIYRDGKFDRTSPRNWSESITIDGSVYTLNPLESSFSKTSTENLKPGVSYYQTITTYKAVYTNNEGKITVNGSGRVYGYNQPWSKVETQSLTLEIDNQVGNKPWQMTVIVKPTMTASKNIFFQKSSPNAISFDGTYVQTLEKESTIKYEILTNHPNLDKKLLEGGLSIKPANSVETLKLAPPGLDFLPFWAEGDVRQLYSLGVMTETPSRNMLYQLTTRGEYVKQLCLALRIDVDKYDDPKGKNPQIFRDVNYTNPYYKYVMAAYSTGISVGVGAENKFGVDQPITRQEAITMLVRTIGLERLGVGTNPRTPFTDDKEIGSWARKEMAAAYLLGIVAGNEQNMVLPNKNINKLETAAIINRMIRYLRLEISDDYIYME